MGTGQRGKWRGRLRLAVSPEQVFATVGQGLHPAAGGGVVLPAQPQHPPPGHKGTCPTLCPQSPGRGRWEPGAYRLQRHRPTTASFPVRICSLWGMGNSLLISSASKWGVALIEQRLSPNYTKTCPSATHCLPNPAGLFISTGQPLTDSLVTPQTWQPQESPP